MKGKLEHTCKTFISAFDIMRKRLHLGLNPICIKCGRVMRTHSKTKYSGDYYCICSPNIRLSVG